MINETNATLLNGHVNGVSQNILDYLGQLPQYIAQRNIVAIIIALILFFIAVAIIKTLSTFLMSFMKRTILFTIVVLIIVDFIPRYRQLISTQGWTYSNVLFGIFAMIAGGFALFIASRALVKSAHHNFKQLHVSMKQRQTDDLEKELAVKKQVLEQQQANLRDVFSREAVSNEKSILAVLVYLIVAEFGVFSSPTLSAPNVQVGMAFFGIFLVGVVIFTKTSYKNFKTATLYFGVTFVVGLVLSFMLGILWGKNTLPQLLSAEFFTSDSLVAMITGMGVSLFAGSKG